MAGRLINIDTCSFKDDYNESLPHVSVLMSTYNGDAYIEQQISSIASQKNVSVSLTVRDDGSTDGTRKHTEQFAEKYGLRYEMIEGPNLGYLKSFETILLKAKDSEFYAFSDQDDVWSSQKLSRAIAALMLAGDEPALYASSVIIANEMLNQTSRNEFPGLAYTLPAELIRHRLAGHTMVWNEALQKKIREYGEVGAWSHDQHVAIVGLMVGANLLFDSTSYVLHRRLSRSVTPGGGSLRKRLQHEIKMTLNESGELTRRMLAQNLLKIGGKSISKEDASFLNLVIRSRESIVNRLRLAFSPYMRCGLTLGDIEARLSVLIGRFS